MTATETISITESYEDIRQIYRDEMLNIAAMYVGDYKSDQKKFIERLNKSEVIKQVLSCTYNYLVSDGLLPIEKLPVEEKKELINKAGNYDVLRICKCLYVLMSI